MLSIDPKWMRFSAVLSGAVTTKVFLIYLGYLGGSWLDRKLGIEPICLFMGVVGAAAVGLWWIFFVLERERKRTR